MNNKEDRIMDSVVIVIIVSAVLLLVGLFVIIVYNSLVKLRNSVKDHWSQIDVQLKRRFDLIPNVVETVKAYAEHEEEALKEVVEARNLYAKSNTHEEAINADLKLNEYVPRLFALAESYPELKSNENFVHLQKELAETEDKIAYARQFYSDSVLKYNNKIQMFPSNIVAGMFGFKEEKFFEATAVERENVKVSFDK
jgi:LemA protein